MEVLTPSSRAKSVALFDFLAGPFIASPATIGKNKRSYSFWGTPKSLNAVEILAIWPLWTKGATRQGPAGDDTCRSFAQGMLDAELKKKRSAVSIGPYHPDQPARSAVR
jgi:hypothetical protein